MKQRLASLAVAICGALIWVAVSSDAALAERRVALVIGNSGYQTVPKLPNPSRDANSVAQMFRNAGFDQVEIALDVGNLDFKRAIRKFEATADQADIAVLYYAGHGIEIGGTNYLIPTDARLASDRDADDEAIQLDRLVTSADGARKLRIVILDACRDNPFTAGMRRERKSGNRGINPGLGKAEPSSTDTLIAYAAKAGSTADDGDTEHSPFTTAILKNLTVPGLDIRLAFGRVRDEVMKNTSNRQEPFVYGSLGGGNISLVPAPAKLSETASADIKGDFDLVSKIGTRRAWEVFLTTYKTGFYSDLAKAQMASLPEPPALAPAQGQVQGQGAIRVVSVEPPPSDREINSREALEWDRIKDTTDLSELQKFIKRFSDAPLAITAARRLDLLKQAAREREEKARAEREAAQKAADEARLRTEQQKAELAAQVKRDEAERRAKTAEAEQKAKAVEAERKADEARRKAEEAERNKAAIEAAALRVESEKKARLAEEERKKAERAIAAEAVCKLEQDKFEAMAAKGSEGSALDDLKTFGKSVGCERLRPQVAAAITKFTAEIEKRAATLPNAPPLIRAAQLQLTRIGCTPGKVDGTLNAPTKAAFSRYLAVKDLAVKDKDKAASEVIVTEALVAELTKATGRVCPLECKSDETVKGDMCAAIEKPAAPVASRRKDDDDEPVRRKRPVREAERQPARSRAAPEQRSRVQASARSGGGNTIIGVGF